MIVRYENRRADFLTAVNYFTDAFKNKKPQEDDVLYFYQPVGVEFFCVSNKTLGDLVPITEPKIEEYISGKYSSNVATLLYFKEPVIKKEKYIESLEANCEKVSNILKEFGVEYTPDVNVFEVEQNNHTTSISLHYLDFELPFLLIKDDDGNFNYLLVACSRTFSCPEIFKIITSFGVTILETVRLGELTEEILKIKIGEAFQILDNLLAQASV